MTRRRAVDTLIALLAFAVAAGVFACYLVSIADHYGWKVAAGFVYLALAMVSGVFWTRTR
jgi:hypothetical protein